MPSRPFALLAVLVSAATAADVAPREVKCQSDSQCVISTLRGCCPGCSCDPGPYAISTADLKAREASCAARDCAMAKCAQQMCQPVEPASHFRAACAHGQCVAARVDQTAAECRSSADCTVVYAAAACSPGPCGCCPGSEPRAVAIDKAPRGVPLTKPGAPPKASAPKDSAGPEFGLSEGNTNHPVQTPPNCQPCPGQQPGAAECSAGRCVLVAPRPRPRPPG